MHRLIKKENILSMLSVVMVAWYPILFLFFQNAELVEFAEIVEVLGLFLLHALIVFLIALIFLRDYAKAGLLTNIVMLIILLFSLIEEAIISILPMLYYWHIVYLLLTIIIIIGYFLSKKTRPELSNLINQVVLLIFSGLTLFNSISAAPVIISRLYNPSINTHGLEITDQTGRDLHIKPNVYLFIFDEYGGYDNLLSCCGYDNTPFYEELAELGFNTAKLSRNHTGVTSIEIPNLLNLELIAQEYRFVHERWRLVENPLIIQIFKEYGYKIHLINDFELLPIDPTIIDFECHIEDEKSFNVDSIDNLIYSNTIYYPALMSGIQDVRIHEINELLRCAQESWAIEPDGLFTLGYFYFPHLPWVVDEFGRKISETNRDNWRDPDVYLGQMKYSSKQILSISQEIIEADPEAIIILQSDHGFRMFTHREHIYGETFDDMDFKRESELNILNAVYYKGQHLALNNKNGVDTVIMVINRLFDLNFSFTEQ